MQEIWKDIKEYEGLYQVSNKGRVRRILFVNNKAKKRKIKILKPNFRNGYVIYCLCKNNIRKVFQAHQLVANAFIENPKKYKIINHKNYDRTDNNINNLEWCTQSYNVMHGAVKRTKLQMKNRYDTFGVYFRKDREVYEVILKGKYIGTFKNKEDAIKKRDEKINEINNTE